MAVLTEYRSAGHGIAESLDDRISALVTSGRHAPLPPDQDVGKGPFGNTRMGMIAKFSIKRSEFGMKKMLDSIGDDVAITFSFEGVLK